jgi:hypothetical protein
VKAKNKDQSLDHIPLGMGVVKFDGRYYGCKCGWKTTHPRVKVMEDRVDQHFRKRHGGRGIRI